MKILQVIPYFAPKRGGDVTVCYNLSKQLVKKGHDVVILTTDFEFDRKFADSIEKEGVKVIPLHCVVNIGLFIYSPSMKKWLKDNMKNFDIIHMHTFRAYQNPLIYHYARKYRIPYFVQAHGSILPIYQKILFKKIYDIIWGYNILNDASGVIALTKTEFDQYKSMGADEKNIIIIPNGIDISTYKNLPEKGSFRKKHSIDSNTKIILYLGRINEIKGIDLLVDSYVNLKKDIPNTLLVIAGPDNGFIHTLKKQIAAQNISDAVLLTGPLYDIEKREAFIDADVYVLPSKYEAFPITILEACACGTPVVLTDRCGISNLIDNNCGISVKYDKLELKNAIIKILNNKQLSSQFSINGKKITEDTFNWQCIVEQFENLYSDIARY